MPERWAIEVLSHAAPGAAVPGSASDLFREAFAALPAFLQSFCVEAYQSHLWNAIARGLVEQRARESGLPLISADDDFGAMHFFPARVLPESWIELTIPMLAPTVVPVAPWGDLAVRLLAAEGLTLAQLRVPGLRRPQFGEASRPLIVSAERFMLAAAEPDDLGRSGRLKRTVQFDLPRSAYATVVLRAIGQ